MNVLINADPFRETGASTGANLKASSNLARAPRPRARVVVPSGIATTERAVMARLFQIAWSGTLSATAAIFATVLDWTVIAWRDFWLVLCIAAFVTFLAFVGWLVGDLAAPEVHP